MVATLSGQYQLAQAAQDFINKTIQKLPPTDRDMINKSAYTLRNEKSRKTYYDRTMNYVPAEEKVLTIEYMRKGIQIVKHVNTFMMVPLQKSLTRMLSSENVLKTVFKSTAVATQSKKKLYLLELSLSFDEIQISSPIGQAKAKHKLMVCYFDLMNCPDFVRSQLDFKMLVFVVESKFLQKSSTSLRRILSDVINTVNNSVNGIPLTTSQPDVLFRVVIKQYPADNLAAHQIFGMKTGFSSILRPCRLCYITREDMKTCFNPGKFNLRTNESYEEEMQQTYEADIRGLTIKGHPFTFRFPLTDIVGFDITQLVFDPFHVILCGGVLSKAIVRLLKHVVIELQLISLADLNDIIRTWEYPPKTGSDKPPTLPVDFFRGDIHLNMKEGNCAPAGIESHLKSTSNMLKDQTAMKHIDDEKEYNRILNGSGCLNVVPFVGVDEEYSSNETVLSELTTLVSPNVATNADLLMAPVIAEVSSIRRRNRENRRIAAGLEVEPRGKPVQVVERMFRFSVFPEDFN
ncbi:unnamed protein product [Allacma fusca]|uniref:Uncharacterized protein n=1 Tax=Allacma fusca TaxID=39272 RepID=A0A8J2NW48_9HEXA|nr:unnamed protein product [Allacma fusca]